MADFPFQYKKLTIRVFLEFLRPTSFLCKKINYSAKKALANVQSKGEIVQTYGSFFAQLKIYKNMELTISSENLQFKMFKWVE